MIHAVLHRPTAPGGAASTPRLGCRPAPRVSQTMACPRGWSLHSSWLPSSAAREGAGRPDMRCQDPMRQSCTGIGCVLVAYAAVSGVTKRDACEMASRAVHRTCPMGLAIHQSEPAPALVSLDALPSYQSKNEPYARQRRARLAARPPECRGRLVRRWRWGWRRADPITLTLGASDHRPLPRSGRGS